MTRASSKLRLLVVDDDEVDRMAVRRVLKAIDASMEIIEARNVKEAISLLEAGDLDCALVDFHLPDGDGFDVVSYLASRESAPPVIMLTGQGDERLAVRLMREGAADYLTKGEFDAARLMRSLRYVTGSRRARDQERATASLHESLASAGALFARSLDLDETLDTVLRIFTPRLADRCEVELDGSDGRKPARRRTGTPIPDAEVDPARSMSIPLVGRGKAFGSIRLFRTPDRTEFTETDTMMASSLADRAAAALDNARLYQGLREETDTVSTLNRLGEALTAQLDTDTLVSTVVTEATRLTGAEYGAFVHKVGDGDRAEFTVFVHASDGVPPITCVQGPVLAELVASLAGGGSRCSDLRVGGEDMEPIPFACDPERPVRSYMAMPVCGTDGDARAALVFAHRETAAFDGRAEEIAAGVARWAGISMDNARLFRDVQAAVQARDDVIAIVSHDLRNPVNVVLSASSLIEELDLDAEDRSKQLRAIQRAGHGMNRLIQDLLDVTRIEANRLSVERVPAEIDGVLTEVHELMTPLAVDREISLEQQIPDGKLRGTLDPDRIVQVFSNLIGNALKFTPPGGTVRYGVRADGSTLRFHVSDTGPGIPEEQVPHLFDRFWQGGRASRDGAGLGLPIARGIVEAHGGCIDLQAGTEGTTFVFDIPEPTASTP